MNEEFIGDTWRLVFGYDDKADFAEDSDSVELANALQECLDSGAKKVLLPITSAADLRTVPAELVGCFSLISYQTTEDAVFKAQEILALLQVMTHTKEASGAGGTESADDEIMKYKQLLDAGAITAEEFETKKKQLLGLQRAE